MQTIFKNGGTQIRVQYFTSTVGSVYDDNVTLTQSGTDLWTSGLVVPLYGHKGGFNSSESLLMQQGKLLENDSRLFIHGSLITTGSEMSATIRIGSPGNEIDKQYSIVLFNRKVDVLNTPIYRQIYIRMIGGTGSLLGESGVV